MRPMEGVSTSTAGFVGMAEKGKVVGTPEFVSSFGLPGYIVGVLLLVIVVFHVLYMMYRLLANVKGKKRG